MATTMSTAIRKGTDSAATAEDAVGVCLSKLGAKKPGLVICYCSAKYDYEKVVATLRRETGRVPLIGCSSAGEFTEDEVATGSIAVGILSSDSHKFFTACSDGLREDPNQCVAKTVAQFPETVEGHPHRSYLLYADGLAGKGEESVLAALVQLGSGVRVSGGTAGDDLKLERTFVFCDDTVAQDSVAMCFWASKTMPATTLRHGHEPLSPLLTFTKVKNNVLCEVDGRPAWDVWKEHVRDSVKALLGLDVDTVSDTTDVFRILGGYEAGLLVGENDYKMRSPLSKNDDGSLNFTCSIYEGSKFRIMKTSEDALIRSAGAAAKHALLGASGQRVAGVLTFDCAARLMILGDEFRRSVGSIRDQIGPGTPLLGFEAYGEICLREGEISGFHNTTTVVTIVPD